MYFSRKINVQTNYDWYAIASIVQFAIVSKYGL